MNLKDDIGDTGDDDFTKDVEQEFDNIADGKIAAVGACGALTDAKRVIDATGKIVMPGGIDPHVHCKWYSPQPDGSIVYLSDVARVQLDSENYETAGWLNGKAAGSAPSTV